MKKLASTSLGAFIALFLFAPHALAQNLPPNVLSRHLGQFNPGSLGSYVDITFTGIPAGSYDVSNGTRYRGWCIENIVVFLTDKNVILYSSLDPNLPLNFRTYQDPAVPASGGVIGKPVPWNELNWLLNNRVGYTMVETQYAIHKLIYGSVISDFLPGQTNGEILYHAAITHPAFVPAVGQIIAIVLYRPGSEGIATTGEQDFIIELVKPPVPHLTVAKTPDGGTFASGAQTTFTIKVTNDGGATATNVQLTDQLPTNGGLSWTNYTATAGVCTISAGSLLSCNLGNILPGDTVTITVMSGPATPPGACQPQPNPAATATADGGLTASDSGSLSCTPPGSLGDRVWYDTNGDGVQDAGEVGLVGWLVNISGPGGYTAMMSTGANGIYGFFNLPAGTYTVCVTPMAGYTQTYDLDGLGTPHCATATLGVGQNRTDVDFGYRLPPTVGLGDYVWSDVNGNGVQDVTEVGINGVTVNLYQCAAPNTVVQTTVTANNPASPNPSKDGYYSFTGLPPGCYIVQFVNPGGFIFSVPNLGGNTALDSNANQATGRTGNINLVAGFDSTIDAGLIPGIDLCPPDGTILPGDGKVGKLFVWQDASFVYARLDQSRNLNDNSYGANIVQWPRSHSFSDLVGSDKAQFIFKNNSGNVVLDFYLDYITAKSGTPSGYANLGVSGGEGRINVGQAAWVADWNSSLAENLNNFGYCSGGNCSGLGTNLLQNSPPTVSGSSYMLPAGSPYMNWSFTNSYYVKVSKTAFGGSAFGGVSIGLIHNSPAKTGSNAISPKPCLPNTGQPCTPQPVTGSVKSDFNGTSISAGRTIWFNSNLKVSGISTTSPTVVTFTNGKVFFNGADYNVPDGTITFDPTASCGKTEYSADGWQTVMPVAGSDEIFITGLALPVPANLPGGIKGVVWSGDFSADQPGVSISWKWSAAVYSQFPADYNQIGVKPAHTSTCLYNNSDHAGTPENYKAYVVGGARGGGGSNFTGSWSGTQSLQLVCDGGGTGGQCSIVDGTVQIKDRNLKWTLSNDGGAGSTLTKLTLTWPQANGMLKKVKFDADVVWDAGAAWTMAGITLDAASFTADPKKKRIDPGKSRVFTLEFENDAASFPYQLTLKFDTGCEVALDVSTGPPTQVAQCSDLKPIEQVVLQYSGAKALSSVSWFRTTVSDINNPGATNLIGNASGADIGASPYSFGNFAAASSTNDVDFVLTFGDGSKQRSRFHLSCSDADMNDITDCGKLQGDGKDNSVTGGNLWLLKDLQGKGLQMCN